MTRSEPTGTGGRRLRPEQASGQAPVQAPAQGPATGIFSADWHKWRGATLRVELAGEPAFAARLDDVGDYAGGASLREATLTLLDGAGKPTGTRRVPWPPEGSVRVLRAP